jgi:hypothetical protein
MSLTLAKKAIITYVFDLLNGKYPTYFPTKREVYWADTVKIRPLDATECYLQVLEQESMCWGIDGEIIYNETEDKYEKRQLERNIITVNIAVTSMKKNGGLSGLQAQNLANEACNFIRRQIKSGEASNYFLYDNTIFTPIYTISNELSSVDDVSVFEETRNRHTFQFQAKFRYDIDELIDATIAQEASVEMEVGETNSDVPAKDVDFTISN